MNRPITTLFMLSSVDGKISTGDVDTRDTDKDFPKIKGVKEGLKQYYDIEKTTDRHSLNSGKVMKKIGMNSNKCPLNCPDVDFIIIDNKQLTKNGVENLIKKTRKLYLITTNKKHPAFQFKDKLELIYYPKKINFKELFKKFKQKYNIPRITIQSGGTFNSVFIREGLIDNINFVYAPCLIGGKNTPTLVDGENIRKVSELKEIKALKLVMIKKLKNSYIQLKYKVIQG
jgi:2,5-diamino-6-(ribosylamino)-4(3H)-pyrimidinone 5'-phosphate reductase